MRPWRRSARKRGGDGDIVFVALEDAAENIPTTDRDLLALDASIQELALRSPRQAHMVECRFFGGLSVTETAAVLGVSESAIERDWRAAEGLASQQNSSFSSRFYRAAGSPKEQVPMESTQWECTLSFFHQAVELPESERRTFLHRPAAEMFTFSPKSLP